MSNCFISGCPTTSKKYTGPRVTTFSCKDGSDRFKRWEAGLSIDWTKKKKPKVLRVCEKHFEPQDVLRVRISMDEHGVIHQFGLDKAELAPGAIPFIPVIPVISKENTTETGSKGKKRNTDELDEVSVEESEAAMAKAEDEAHLLNWLEDAANHAVFTGSEFLTASNTNQMRIFRVIATYLKELGQHRPLFTVQNTYHELEKGYKEALAYLTQCESQIQSPEVHTTRSGKKRATVRGEHLFPLLA